jgi:hypothetical protein
MGKQGLEQTYGVIFEMWAASKTKTIPSHHKLFHKLPKVTARQNTQVSITFQTVE